MKGNTIKLIGAIVILIGMVGGLILGEICRIPVTGTAVSEFSSPSVTMQFNFAIMIVVWVVLAILGFTFIVTGQIVENQEKVILCLSRVPHNKVDVAARDDSEIQTLVDKIDEGQMNEHS